MQMMLLSQSVVCQPTILRVYEGWWWCKWCWSTKVEVANLQFLESIEAGGDANDAAQLKCRLPVLESMEAGGDASDAAQFKCRLPTYNS